LSEDEEKKIESAAYWGRCAMGALLGALYAVCWRPDLGSFLTAMSFAIFGYLVSYFVLSIALGDHRVEMIGGKSKLQTLGIGIFFLSFLFAWILLYSLFFYAG